MRSRVQAASGISLGTLLGLAGLLAFRLAFAHPEPPTGRLSTMPGARAGTCW